jgi:hypothetical protein
MSMLGGLGFGGGDSTPGAAAGAPEAAGLSPFQAGQQVLGGGENAVDDVKGRAKQALSTDKIGDVEATTRNAAASLGNPDTAMSDNVKNSIKGMTDMALTGGKTLAGDAVGFLGGGAPAPGKLEQSLNGGLQSLLSTVAPATPVREAISLAKRS